MENKIKTVKKLLKSFGSNRVEIAISEVNKMVIFTSSYKTSLELSVKLHDNEVNNLLMDQFTVLVNYEDYRQPIFNRS